MNNVTIVYNPVTVCNFHSSLLMTPEMVEAAKAQRAERLEAALERMNELQMYNETYVLGGQKRRIVLLENLLVGMCFVIFYKSAN